MATEFSRAKAAADRAFSLYIRIRDASTDGTVQCCTCGLRMPWKYSQAGHFVTRTHLSTRWDERNAHAQCAKCNKWEGGEQYKHAQYVDGTHGKGTADELVELGARIVKRGSRELREIAEDYQRQAKELAEEKGLEL